MKLIHEQFITDESGKRSGVILDMPTYQKILDVLEDISDVRIANKRRKDERISIEKFMAQLKEEKLV